MNDQNTFLYSFISRIINSLLNQILKKLSNLNFEIFFNTVNIFSFSQSTEGCLITNKLTTVRYRPVLNISFMMNQNTVIFYFAEFDLFVHYLRKIRRERVRCLDYFENVLNHYFLYKYNLEDILPSPSCILRK